MDTELQAILSEVEAYLVAAGITATNFGRAAVGDVAALTRMRRGKALTSARMSAMRRFMADNPPAGLDETAA